MGKQDDMMSKTDKQRQTGRIPNWSLKVKHHSAKQRQRSNVSGRMLGRFKQVSTSEYDASNRQRSNASGGL